MDDSAFAWYRPLERLSEGLSVQQVFGEPVTQAGRTVIPMAAIHLAFGLGGGSGRANVPDGGGNGDGGGSGGSGSGGGGGGGRVTASPVGVVELNADGVHVHISPHLVARVMMVGLLVVGWNVFWIMRAMRERWAGGLA